MIKKSYIYGLCVFIFLVLSVTNPSKSDFDQFISSYIRDYVLQISEDNDTANLASGISFLILQSNNNIIKHNNYIIFSRFKLDASVIRTFGYNADDIIIIGAFNKFIPINGINQNIM